MIPEAINPIVIGGASQPLLDIADCLESQGMRHHAFTCREVAWMLRELANSVQAIEFLKERAEHAKTIQTEEYMNEGPR